MENFLLKTKLGIISIDEYDMHRIHKFYEIQCTMEYLKNTYEDWSKSKIEAIAYETRRLMDKYEYTEEEAIDIAIKDYGKTTITEDWYAI